MLVKSIPAYRMQSHRSFDPIGIHLQVNLLGSYYYLNRLGFGDGSSNLSGNHSIKLFLFAPLKESDASIFHRS